MRLMLNDQERLAMRASHTRKIHLRETIRVAHIYLSNILMRISEQDELQDVKEHERLVQYAMQTLPTVINKFNYMRLSVRPSATVGDLKREATFAKIEWKKVEELGTKLGLRYDVKDPILGDKIDDIWLFIDRQLDIAALLHVQGPNIEWAQERLRQEPL